MFRKDAIPTFPVKDCKRRIIEIVGVALLYFLLFIIATYPTITVFDSHFIGQGDTSQNAWNLWWAHWALSHGHLNLYDTSMIYYPEGVTLAFHTLSPFNGILGATLQALSKTNLPLTYNLIALLTFVGSGISMYLLVHSLTGCTLAAVVSGIIFTFSPFRMSRVFFGNLEVYSTQFIPLLALLLIKMQRDPRIRYAVGAAIMLALTTWCSLELAFGAGLLTCLLFLLGIKSYKRRDWLYAWAIFGITSFGLILPVAMPMLLHRQSFPMEADQLTSSMRNSADLLGFIVPDNTLNSPLWKWSALGIKPWISQIYAQFYGNPCEKTVFLGYTVLGIVVVTMLGGHWRLIWQWLSIGAVFFVLCLGPTLQMGGKFLGSMPYRLFFYLPLLKYGRTPNRLAVYLMLALAVVAGYGVAELCRRRKAGWYIGGFLGLLVFCEFLIIPLRSDGSLTNLSPYYPVLAKQETESPILDVPVDLYGAQGPAGTYMLYQTLHQQPIVGGYISRTPTNALSVFEYPFIYQLRARLYSDHEPYTFSPELIAVAESNLEALGVRYIILHKDVLPEQETVLLYDVICKVLAHPIHEDEYIVVWERDL
jgi:intracellular septation protein A